MKTEDGVLWGVDDHRALVSVPTSYGFDSDETVELILTKEDLILMLAKVSEVNGHAQHAPGLWQCPNDYCPVCMHDSMTQGASPEPEAQNVVFTDELDSPRNDPNLS